MKIKQIAKRVKRALRASGELQRIIDFNQGLDTKIARERVLVATTLLKRANRTLGHALYYCGDHNIPIPGEPVPKPFRDARPKRIQRLNPA